MTFYFSSLNRLWIHAFVQSKPRPHIDKVTWPGVERFSSQLLVHWPSCQNQWSNFYVCSSFSAPLCPLKPYQRLLWVCPGPAFFPLLPDCYRIATKCFCHWRFCGNFPRFHLLFAKIAFYPWIKSSGWMKTGVFEWEVTALDSRDENVVDEEHYQWLLHLHQKSFCCQSGYSQ